jgi:integrase
MRGSIAKKGKRWYAVVYDGVDPATGKYRRRWIPAGTRRGDAEKLLTELVKRSHEGNTVVGDKMTFGAYLTERWLPVQKARLRRSTFDSYRRNIERHVVPALGSVPLDKLAVEDLDLFYARLLTEGRKSKNGEIAGLSPKTVLNIHLVLNKALADAYRKGTVVRNVAALADAPSLSARRRPEIKAWDADQLARFLDALASHRLYAAFHAASHTGMRRGEILGLRWSDVDTNASRLSVRQALVSVAYEVHVSDVKTGSGRRTIDLDPGTVDVLTLWRIQRAEESGRESAPDDLVFAKRDGALIHPDLFSQTFDRTVAKLVIPPISLHDLRHTHATLLLKAGVPVKVVSERLGHANAAFTMTVYQHVLPGMQSDAADLFAELVASRRSAADTESRTT